MDADSVSRNIATILSTLVEILPSNYLYGSDIDLIRNNYLGVVLIHYSNPDNFIS